MKYLPLKTLVRIGEQRLLFFGTNVKRAFGFFVRVDICLFHVVNDTIHADYFIGRFLERISIAICCYAVLIFAFSVHFEIFYVFISKLY